MALKVVLMKEAMTYFEALVDNGIFLIDTSGTGDFPPEVKDVVAGLHELLSGGDVEVTIKTPGNPAVRADLDNKLQAALSAVNAVNVTSPTDKFTP